MRIRDPVELEVFKNLYHSIAEEMGAALRHFLFPKYPRATRLA
jgi:N-methylhydantoinase B/oxoprolinase/acetone carboxylase alpha subunit